MIIAHVFGGLGNQMFQYAFGRAIASKLQSKLVLDLSKESLGTLRSFELDNVFNIEAKIATELDLKKVLGWRRHDWVKKIFKKIGASNLLYPRLMEEPHFYFAPQIFPVIDDIYISGYWQSEKYFKEIEATIRQEFTFRQPLSSLSSALVVKIRENANTAISLHVRRGDYVSNSANNRVHGVCSLDYYQAAVEYIAERVAHPFFYIFSDDIEWVRTNIDLSFPYVLVDHNRGASSYEDMFLISVCKHHIIANSSFSWWGAWLSSNPDKIIITPRNWFSDENMRHDLFPQSWIVL